MKAALVAQIYAGNDTVISAEKYGQGNINDTYLVKTSADPFILQRLNDHVFKNPPLIMENMAVFTKHMQGKAAKEKLAWNMPSVIPTPQKQTFYLSSDHEFWRALTFVPNAVSFETIQNLAHAEEIGRALGIFHYLISDLPVNSLHDTLPGYHIAPDYLTQFDQVAPHSKRKINKEAQFCLDFISARRNLIPVLENAKAAGRLPLRPVHGDPKVNNVLIDQTTGRAISLVDLDTVKPGLIQNDVGDCLRSGCNPLGENTADWEKVEFNLEVCRALLKGYLPSAGPFLTPNDYHFLYPAIHLLPFELGLRFFADYLNGDIYFKVKFPEHNLARALVQFQLTRSIEQQEKALTQLINRLVL